MARLIQYKLTSQDFIEATQGDPRAWRGVKREPAPEMVRRRPELSTMIDRARRFITSMFKRPR